MFFDLGYGLTAASYTIFLLLLLTVRNAGLARHFLLLATLVTAVWAALHISYIDPVLGREKILIYDSVRQLVWIVFLSACLRADFSNVAHFLSHRNTLIALILPVATVVTNVSQMLPSTWQFIFHTLVALQSLVMTELVFRQSGNSRWAFKPLVIFLAVIGIIDFVTYANAIMLNTLSWDFFAARGYIFFAILPLLFISARRIKHWGIEIFVSREVVLHSTLLMIAGVYLLMMATLGYVVQYYGGDWNTGIQIALAVVALVFLAALLLSHQVRTTIKVFITKHFYANQYDYRVEWVALTKHLAVIPDAMEGVYQKALIGWLNSIGYNQGALYKKQGNEVVLVASSEANQSAINDVFQQAITHYFDQKYWIIDIDELRVKPEVYEGLPQISNFMQDFEHQLIIPMTRNDEIWGFMTMSTTEEHDKKTLNWELRDYINAISEQITSYILNAESRQALAENAQFAAFNRMSAFVVHDLKNVLAQINMIISNAEQHKRNPEFIDDTFETLEHTKARMDKMLKQLMQKNKETLNNTIKVDLSDLIESLISEKCQGLLPLPAFENTAPVYAMIDAEKISNVLYHLINNAQQATPDDGFVKVTAAKSDTNVLISIEDSGSGMSEEFIRTRLFKPFETTKGNAGMGIGAYDAKTFIEEVGGSVTVSSALGRGTAFNIKLPSGV